MNSALRLLVLLALLAAGTWILRRRDASRRPVPILWAFGPNLLRAVFGHKGLALLVAVGLTVPFVLLGWDRGLQDLWQELDPLGQRFPWWMLRYGAWWTPTVAVGLFLAAWAMRRKAWQLAGAVATQAVLAGLTVTLTLKLLSGRRGPASPAGFDAPPFPKSQDACDFAFDFWNRTFADGRFFWPSGHTLSSMVLVAALSNAFPERRWIAWVGYPLVALMGAAMLDGDFHWTSDILAGVVLGYATGRVVGTRMRREHDARRQAGNALATPRD